ncbi:MAG: glycosyltransferase family 4 protein [Gammaproteobacteria bacterium]|nr:MAG: glycosyltransferase family 4 protein [Gammaproteobacteria bacterium]
MISSLKATERRHASIRSASLYVIMHADSPVRLATRTSPLTRCSCVEYSPMSAILFFDWTCQKPYDSRTLRQQAMGGTEASITRIADALDAFVIQHNRTEAYGRYRPPQRISGITHVILNRDSRALPTVRELYPEARVYLWVHDQLNPGSKRARRLASTAALLREMSVTVICVSDSQRRGLEATLRRLRVADRVRACTLYNPVDDALAPDGSPVDDRKLVFFSSPNKGLKFTLDAFRALRRQMPDLRLVVGNPGYKIRQSAQIEGVEYLGPQPQERIHAQVRTALCTFFPNFVLPETFGLVFAESKAVGTPVLTHDCGAAAEVLADPQQTLPVTFAQRAYEGILGDIPAHWRGGPARLAAALGLFDPYIERIRNWRSGARPVTGPDPRFRLTEVANQWRALLSSER